MINKMVTFIARHAGIERSVSVRIISLIIGFIFFFVIVPIALGIIGHWITRYFTISIPQLAEVVFSIVGIALGLFFLLWSISTFWLAGKGTPVPLASPVKLVTSGPFKYTRNPIKLGAILFYFGIGTSYDGIVTGLVMMFIGVALGTLYHKLVEEKELVIRFGKDYEEYRKQTSFLIPLPPRESR